MEKWTSERQTRIQRQSFGTDGIQLQRHAIGRRATAQSTISSTDEWQPTTHNAIETVAGSRTDKEGAGAANRHAEAHAGTDINNQTVFDNKSKGGYKNKVQFQH